MSYYCVVLVLAVSILAKIDACQFGSDAIQEVYDRFELFRKTKAFDPSDSIIPLTRYDFYNDNGIKTLGVRIKGVYISETYETDDYDKIKTLNGQYRDIGRVILNYKREGNGEFSFEDGVTGKTFKSSLQSIDAELPNDFEEDYKKVLVDLNALRKEMFDFQKYLSEEGFDHVHLFDFSPFLNGDGFFARYSDKDGGVLTVNKDGENGIYGRLKCDYKAQKYNILDGKVVADGEPFAPI